MIDHNAHVVQNLPLVKYLAHKLYRNRLPVQRLGIDDAIQEGVLGMMKALKALESGQFDQERMAAFTAYQATCIRGAIMEAAYRFYSPLTTPIVSFRANAEPHLLGLAMAGLKCSPIDKVRRNEPESRWSSAETEAELAEVREKLNGLEEKDGSLLRLRFFEGKTLRELGDVEGVTVEGMRLREKKALRKLGLRMGLRPGKAV